MLSRGAVFYFLISFFIVVLTAVFFVWNAFASPDKGFLRFLSASLTSSSTSEDVIPAMDTDQDFPPEEIVEDSVDNNENQNLIIAPSLPAQTGESVQDQLDNIQEKLDVISYQVQELVAEQKMESQLTSGDVLQGNNDNRDKIKADEIAVGSTGLLNVLISEVQAAAQSDQTQEFVELYNPSGKDIDLTGWYLQRKTKTANGWSSFVLPESFQGKFIPAQGYFLICRSGYYFTHYCDIFTDNPITDDNSFALKTSNGDISDKLGFGDASDQELLSTQNPGAGQSIGRKFLNGEEMETNNNSFDFEIQIPTPKRMNVAYSQPQTQISSGGGGIVAPVLKNILISEVLPAGASDEKQEFVELYNPNNEDVDLTSWYLQKKTASGSAWSTYAPGSLFAGKTITANGYFLIARTGYYADLADIFTDYAVTDNNSFALKNPNGDISDKLGFGGALDFELLATVSPSSGQSIGRKFISDGAEQDTDDNSSDFEIDTPTPKAQNIKWSEPVLPTIESIVITTPANKLIYTVGDALDITGLVVTGTYSDGSTKAETIAPADIAGFDSSVPVSGQVLTITFVGQTATYTITVNPAVVLPVIIEYTFNGIAQNIVANPAENPVRIDLTANENVKWVHMIIENDLDPDIRKDYNLPLSCDGTNKCSETWNGAISTSGKTLADGLYRLKIHIEDAAGDDFNDYVTPYTITVDTELF